MDVTHRIVSMWNYSNKNLLQHIITTFFILYVPLIGNLFTQISRHRKSFPTPHIVYRTSFFYLMNVMIVLFFQIYEIDIIIIGWLTVYVIIWVAVSYIHVDDSIWLDLLDVIFLMLCATSIVMVEFLAAYDLLYPNTIMIYSSKAMRLVGICFINFCTLQSVLWMLYARVYYESYIWFRIDTKRTQLLKVFAGKIMNREKIE